jgi:hypothetical protein
MDREPEQEPVEPVEPAEPVNKYADHLIDLDDQIAKYYDDVERLWNVVIAYRSNPNHAAILDRLDVQSTASRTAFYDLMSWTPTMRVMMESRRRLVQLVQASGCDRSLLNRGKRSTG